MMKNIILGHRMYWAVSTNLYQYPGVSRSHRSLYFFLFPTWLLSLFLKTNIFGFFGTFFAFVGFSRCSWSSTHYILHDNFTIHWGETNIHVFILFYFYFCAIWHFRVQFQDTSQHCLQVMLYSIYTKRKLLENGPYMKI